MENAPPMGRPRAVAIDDPCGATAAASRSESAVGHLEAEIARLRAANDAWKEQVDAMAARISTIGREATAGGRNARRFRRRVDRAFSRLKIAWKNLKERHANELRELRALHEAVETFQMRAHALGEYSSANAILDAAAAACPALVSRVTTGASIHDRSKMAALDVCLGSTRGASFSVRSLDGVAETERVAHRVVGIIATWQRVVVRSTGVGGSKRAWVIVPGNQENAIEHGEFYVRGSFLIEARSNNPKKADELWRSTKPE